MTGETISSPRRLRHVPSPVPTFEASDSSTAQDTSSSIQERLQKRCLNIFHGLEVAAGETRKCLCKGALISGMRRVNRHAGVPTLSHKPLSKDKPLFLERTSVIAAETMRLYPFVGSAHRPQNLGSSTIPAVKCLRYSHPQQKHASVLLAGRQLSTRVVTASSAPRTVTQTWVQVPVPFLSARDTRH
ncbi:hypothetical protein BDW02DRAFT_574087 [Decorospora gaudefroyi]|uniref:Uncharacterized protein n=1 Tax=Decorospora gaudefroyi TaxID=184978 RepID=A0A6A5JZU2_9PLEO|nr:hypothetical protein BDW02DRAFT_574087 [Decorospora gaudefroyi]